MSWRWPTSDVHLIESGITWADSVIEKWPRSSQSLCMSMGNFLSWVNGTGKSPAGESTIGWSNIQRRCYKLHGTVGK